MNKYLNFIIITLIVILLGSCSQPTNNRETFVRSFLERYPKATLCIFISLNIIGKTTYFI